MRKGNLPVDARRIASDIEALAALTEPGHPWTRRAFTPMFLKGRDYLSARMRAAGLETRIDAAGNLIGRRKGRAGAKGTLIIGSHSDTVPDGGRFDGIAGVIAGLEVLRALDDAGIALDHDVEVVDFLAEEVSLFGVSCIGSRGMTGQRPVEWLDRVNEGRTLREAIAEVGGNADAPEKRDDIAAFLELHIEQGPVLEESGDEIGIVTAITGITRVAIAVEGRPDHAGTTPMDRRADALVAASRLVLAIRDKALDLSGGPNHFAATVGEFSILPGAANVVPGKAELLVDIRASARADMEAFLAWLLPEAESNGAHARIISEAMPTPSAPALCERLEEAADRIGAKHRRMVSGAGHDTAWVAKIAPAAMIFIACKGGRSHCPEEWAQTEDVALGAAVLFETITALDREPATDKQ